MTHRSKLLWRCHRGMREMDILFQNYLNRYYDDLSKEEKDIFDNFLNEIDNDIYAWIMDRDSPETPGYEKIVSQLKKCL
jgi:antitoxin CptB